MRLPTTAAAQEKSFGWFLNRHDLAATYSAIVIASVWDSMAIDTSVSNVSDDLASLDHAQPAHGEHGPLIEQAVAEDSLLQNIQAFHGTDDRSVLTAAALDLDGQDAVHDVNEPAVAGLEPNPFGLHSESSHYDNAAVSSARDVFRAENNLGSKLADFRPQQDDGFPIAASEQVERTVTHQPVSSSTPSNPTPDDPAPQQVSTASTAAIAHSDTTITPDNHSSASHVEDTINPLILNVTSLSDAIEAPVSDLQPEVTSIGEPAAPVDQVASTIEPAAPVDQVASTIEPAAPVDQVASTIEPADQLNYAALSDDVTASPLELSGPMQAFDHQAQHDLEACMSDGSTLSIVGIDMHHTANALA